MVSSTWNSKTLPDKRRLRVGQGIAMKIFCRNCSYILCVETVATFCVWILQLHIQAVGRLARPLTLASWRQYNERTFKDEFKEGQ